MKCKLVDRLPIGQQWSYELKLDRYRALAIKTAAGVKLISRNQKDLTGGYPEPDSVDQLRFKSGVLDGEIVALDAAGKPSFQDLQYARAPGDKSRRILYFAFDLLNLEGKSLLNLPLVERKQILADLLRDQSEYIRYLAFLDGEPEQIVKAIEREALEGIVAKVTKSRYKPDKRSGSWSKFEIGLEQEFVIGGYTRGNGARGSFDALIVGHYDQGKLRYASKVGTGFSNAQIATSSSRPPHSSKRRFRSTTSRRARAHAGATA